MPIRTSDAEWQGTLMEGKGKLRFGGGAYEGPYDFRSRMQDGPGTNPEELIAAAHAGCFSMALSAIMGNAGLKPTSVHTTAKVHFDKQESGFSITKIELTTEGVVPGLDQDGFAKHAETAKANCPVSRALSVPISVSATLKG